jgi:integrase/recombinase XerD
LQQITTLDSLEIFILNCDAKSLSPNSIKYYRSKVMDYIRWAKDKPLTDVSANELRRYLVQLSDRGLNTQSCHSYARAIKAWLNFCVEEDFLTISPMKKVSMPKKAKVKPVILTDKEIKLCLGKCESFRDRLILLVSLDTGLRANELVSLNFENVHESRINVIGKGNKERHVFIGSKTKLLLAKYRLERDKPDDTEPIFVSNVGTRLTVSGIMQFYKRLRKQTKLAKLTSHTIRRTALTTMLKSGMSLYHLKEIAGHEDIKTLQHYIDVSDDLERSHSQHGVVDRL